MSRFHLVRCHSSAEFLALLAVLPQRLQQMRVRGAWRASPPGRLAP
jgi:hypothetical protein